MMYIYIYIEANPQWIYCSWVISLLQLKKTLFKSDFLGPGFKLFALQAIEWGSVSYNTSGLLSLTRNDP